MKVSEQIRADARKAEDKYAVSRVLGPLQDAVSKMSGAIHSASRDIIHLEPDAKAQVVETMIDMLELEIKEYQKEVASLKKIKVK